MPYSDDPATKSNGNTSEENFNIRYRDEADEEEQEHLESFDIDQGGGYPQQQNSLWDFCSCSQLGCCLFGIAMGFLAIVIFTRESNAAAGAASGGGSGSGGGGNAGGEDVISSVNPAWPDVVTPPSKNESSSSSMSYSSSTSSGNKVLDQIRKELEPISGKALLHDKTSDQYKAAEWLAEHGPIPDSTMVEAYVLVLLYYATNGTSWKLPAQFLSPDKSICMWHSSSAKGVWCEGDVEHISSIKLEQNQLSGTLPSELVHLSHLRELSLDKNDLRGTIPTEYGLFSTLHKFSLYTNHLTGTIPTELGQIGSEEQSDNFFFTVAANQLTGTIPTELVQISMRFCYLNNNELTGTMPTEFGNAIYLNTINFSHNKLKGLIPTELSNLQRLGYLWLHNNDFTGDIPTQLGLLSPAEVHNIELNSNHLIGTIPTDLGRLSGLATLRLQDNLLAGNANHIFCQPTYVGSNENSISAKFKRLQDLEMDSCDDDAPIQCDCCCCGEECK